LTVKKLIALVLVAALFIVAGVGCSSGDKTGGTGTKSTGTVTPPAGSSNKT